MNSTITSKRASQGIGLKMVWLAGLALLALVSVFTIAPYLTASWLSNPPRVSNAAPRAEADDRYVITDAQIESAHHRRESLGTWASGDIRYDDLNTGWCQDECPRVLAARQLGVR